MYKVDSADAAGGLTPSGPPGLPTDRTDFGNSLHHGLRFLYFVGLAWLQACSEQPGEAPGSPSWEGAKGPQAEPAESWGRWEEPRGVAPPACTRHPCFRAVGSGGWALRGKRGRLTGPTPWQPARRGLSSKQRNWSGLGPQTGLGAGVWLCLCRLVLRDQGQALSMGIYMGVAGLQAGEQYLSQPQTGWGRCRVCRPPLLAGTGPAGNLAAEGKRKTLECENQLHLRGSIASHRSQGTLRPGAVHGGQPQEASAGLL